MHKYFTKELTQSLKVIFLGLVLGAGISVASAMDWTPPPATAPTCPDTTLGCNAPINISATPQTKGIGSLNATTDGYTLTVNKPSATGYAKALEADGILGVSTFFNLGDANFGWAGIFQSAVSIAGSLSVVGPTTLDVSGSTGSAGTRALTLISNANAGNSWANSVTIASPSASNLTIYDDTNQQPMSLRAQDGKFNGQVGIGNSFNTSQPPTWRSGGLDIDLTGNGFPQSVDAIAIKSGAGSPSGNIVLQNTPALRLWSDSTQTDGQIWAGSARLTGGAPAAGNVLVARDSDGNATWGGITGGGISTTVVSQDCSVGGTGNQGGGVDNIYNSCRNVNDGVGSTIEIHAGVICPSGYIASGGGGDCEHLRPNGSGQISQPIMNGNNPVGWELWCGRGDAHAKAVCIKVDPVHVATNYIATPITGGNINVSNIHLVTDYNEPGRPQCGYWKHVEALVTVSGIGGGTAPIKLNGTQTFSGGSASVMMRVNGSPSGLSGVTASATVTDANSDTRSFTSGAFSTPPEGHPVPATGGAGC